MNGKPASPQTDARSLALAARDIPDGPFTLETEVEIQPEANTALEGLYMSKGMYCTQCEAEGFRKITYYPDRPDVMSRFKVRIESDLPVLLSNGNPTASGKGWAEWDDPWPKPALSFRPGRRRSSRPFGQVLHRLGPPGRPAYLGPPGGREPLRLCDGQPDPLDALG